MTAQIIPLPDHVLTLSAAREVLRCEGSTPIQLLMACEALARSPDMQDRIDARETRAAVWAQPGAELRPEAKQLAARLASRMLTPEEISACRVPPRPDMGHLFEALDHPRRQSWATRAAWMVLRPMLSLRPRTYIIAAVVVGASLHIGIAAVAKAAHDAQMHAQIEARQ